MKKLFATLLLGLAHLCREDLLEVFLSCRQALDDLLLFLKLFLELAELFGMSVSLSD